MYGSKIRAHHLLYLLCVCVCFCYRNMDLPLFGQTWRRITIISFFLPMLQTHDTAIFGDDPLKQSRQKQG